MVIQNSVMDPRIQTCQVLAEKVVKEKYSHMETREVYLFKKVQHKGLGRDLESVV